MARRIFRVVDNKWLTVEGEVRKLGQAMIRRENIKTVHLCSQPRHLKVVYEEWYPKCTEMGRHTFRVEQRCKIQIVILSEVCSIREVVSECLDLELPIVKEIKLRRD